MLQIYQQLHYRSTGTPSKPSQSGLQLLPHPLAGIKIPLKLGKHRELILIRAQGEHTDRQNCSLHAAGTQQGPGSCGQAKAASPSLFGAQHQTNPLHFQHHCSHHSHCPRAGTEELHLSEAKQLLTFQGVTNAKLS